jgi:uncharacterized protein (TIGR02246 family)
MRKLVCLGVVGLLLLVGAPVVQGEEREAGVRRAVNAFYAAFNDGFTSAADFATDEWAHINPGGGWTRGREHVLEEVREVHATFLKGVTDTVDAMDVRFASREVAIVTVTSVMSPFETPDGIRHENERHIRTFVVVRRGGRWLVMQDQNTTIAAPPKIAT